MPNETVHRWRRFNANGESPEVAWRATEARINATPGGQKIPNTAETMDAALVDERGYVRAEHEHAQRRASQSTT